MAFYSELTVNISKTDAKLVVSPDNPSELNRTPTWILGEVRELKIRFVRQAAVGTAAVTIEPATGVALRILYGDIGVDHVTSATAGPAVNDVYTVILPLNTPDVAAYLGTLPRRTGFLQFELKSLSTLHKFQVPIVLCCPVGDTPLVDPAPPDTGLGTIQASALFVPKVGLPGVGFILTSEDGGQTRIWRSNDGEVHFDNITP